MFIVLRMVYVFGVLRNCFAVQIQCCRRIEISGAVTNPSAGRKVSLSNEWVRALLIQAFPNVPSCMGFGVCPKMIPSSLLVLGPLQFTILLRTSEVHPKWCSRIICAAGNVWDCLWWWYGNRASWMHGTHNFWQRGGRLRGMFITIGSRWRYRRYLSGRPNLGNVKKSSRIRIGGQQYWWISFVITFWTIRLE